VSVIGRPPSEFFYNVETLCRLTGQTRNQLYQARKRGDLNPEGLESVLVWLCRHAGLDLRRRMIFYALERLLPERPGLKVSELLNSD